MEVITCKICGSFLGIKKEDKTINIDIFDNELGRIEFNGKQLPVESQCSECKALIKDNLEIYEAQF